MTTKLEKTIPKPETKPTPPMTAMQVCNAQVTAAKRAGRSEGERLRVAWMDHRNTVPTVAADWTVIETVAAQTRHRNEQEQSRAKSQNFDFDRYVSSLLDVEANQALLYSALAFLRDKHEAALKVLADRKAAAVAPTKSGLAKLVESVLGSPQAEPAPIAPPVRPPPWWETENVVDIATQLQRLQSAIDAWPAQSFEDTVGALNATHSAIVALNARPRGSVEPPPLYRYTFIPKHG